MIVRDKTGEEIGLMVGIIESITAVQVRDSRGDIFDILVSSIHKADVQYLESLRRNKAQEEVNE